MKFAILYPGDRIRLELDGSLSQTFASIAKISNDQLDESERFLKEIPSVPKGTVLEVGSVHIRGRHPGDSYVTFKVLGGALFADYADYSNENDIQSLARSISGMKEQLATLNEEAARDLRFDIKNREKRLGALEKKRTRNGFIKVLKIDLSDVEAWSIFLESQSSS